MTTEYLKLSLFLFPSCLKDWFYQSDILPGDPVKNISDYWGFTKPSTFLCISALCAFIFSYSQNVFKIRKRKGMHACLWIFFLK